VSTPRRPRSFGDPYGKMDFEVPRAASYEAAEWRTYASCASVNPEIFFSDDKAVIQDAKNICASCPVAEECGNFSNTSQPKHGVWDGQKMKNRSTKKKDGV